MAKARHYYCLESTEVPGPALELGSSASWGPPLGYWLQPGLTGWLNALLLSTANWCDGNRAPWKEAERSFYWEGPVPHPTQISGTLGRGRAGAGWEFPFLRLVSPSTRDHLVGATASCVCRARPHCGDRRGAALGARRSPAVVWDARAGGMARLRSC
jgi:hypothetical protein